MAADYVVVSSLLARSLDAVARNRLLLEAELEILPSNLKKNPSKIYSPKESSL